MDAAVDYVDDDVRSRRRPPARPLGATALDERRDASGDASEGRLPDGRLRRQPMINLK